MSNKLVSREYPVIHVNDATVFGGRPDRSHYYIVDEDGLFHQAKHLFVKDPRRIKQLQRGYCVKCKNPNLFSGCPFLVEKEGVVIPHSEEDLIKARFLDLDFSN